MLGPFFHPLNVVMVLALGASALLTGSALPILVGAGAEVLWLILARSLESQRRYFGHRSVSVADPDRELLRSLTDDDRRRHVELSRLRDDIKEIVAREGGVSKEMLADELPKVDHLVASFVRVASSAARLEDFGRGTDLDRLEEEVRRQEKVVEKTKDEEARAVAAQNLDLMQKRLERAAEVRRRIKDGRGQLTLLENTVRLLRDQIATIDSPTGATEIRARLDDLVRSVDVIEASARETEAVEHGRAGRIAAVREKA